MLEGCERTPKDCHTNPIRERGGENATSLRFGLVSERTRSVVVPAASHHSQTACQNRIHEGLICPQGRIRTLADEIVARIVSKGMAECPSPVDTVHPGRTVLADRTGESLLARLCRWLYMEEERPLRPSTGGQRESRGGGVGGGLGRAGVRRGPNSGPNSNEFSYGG